ncbi:fatty-acid amide hydrolase 2 isoform X2 [Cephus cinctus]|uniref:Fatty-acid amide hydrolase 2 isoform X2 n=1 Tax=Cephus cinctus TaxID=211228 RepID=A0AAJ7C8R0_CEPCN|nr:fatty-acid amide hydrolase 2 isoform X2 [Cephus cinctus]
MCTSVRNKVATKHQVIDVLKKLFCDLLRCFIVQLHALLDFFIDFFCGLYYDKKAKRVPPVKNDLLLDSAVTLAEKIRSRKVTAEEVVCAFIERCKEVNGLINAIVEETYSNAIEEAKNVDKLLNSEANPEELKKTKPFLGVPFTTKESNEVKGLLHSMGLISRRNHRSENDATVVAYLKEAGGILLGKTNVPELNLWCESRNNVYGQTNNPYNTTRTVGGSSGGDGAIVAACGAPFSICSDIGGSVRMPAFFNGVFGYKPTEGITPLKGVGLRSEDYPNSMAEVGPICKKAEDLLPFLRVLVGPNITKLKLDTPVNLKDLNIFYQEGSGDIRASKVNSSMRAALIRAVRHFERLTGSASKIKIPGSEYSYRLWRYWMSQENINFKSNITNMQGNTSAKAELFKLLKCQSELTLAAILKLVDEDILPKENSEWAKTVTANMKKYLLEKLGDNGVLFYPSSPFSAVYHYSTYLRPFNFGYWCLFNVLRLPVCQVPMGLDENGLPVGLQVVAAPYNDHLCLAVARELENAFGGWVPPS